MADECFALLVIQGLEIEERRSLKRQRVFRTKVDAFDIPEDHFCRLFRLSKIVAKDLIDDLRPLLMKPTRRSALSVQTRVLTVSRFFASGSYQLGIGQDFTLSISQKSVSRSIRSVSNAIAKHMLKKWVIFPLNLRNLTELKAQFYEKYAFPGVIGAIDCTHVAIIAPPTEDPIYPEHQYVNRKGYHSLNVQLICDANMQILNVNARFPGSVHDSFIWKNSNVRKALERWHEVNQNSYTWLLGDSGYPLEPWLMTPLLDHHAASHLAYNKKHSEARSIIEQCNGLLKNRWRCLLKHRVLHYHPETASEIITACVVLHNICLKNNISIEEIPRFQMEEQALDSTPIEDISNCTLLAKAKHIQQHLLRLCFT